MIAVCCLYADIYIMASNSQLLLNCRSEYIFSYHAHNNNIVHTSGVCSVLFFFFVFFY